VKGAICNQAEGNPDLKEVRAFANHLHNLGKHWQGEIFGWSAEYTPESHDKPADSIMTFTPADFWIVDPLRHFVTPPPNPPHPS
jgi:hypothetical protein